MLKVVHIDDSPAIVASLSRLLSTVPGVDLVGTAGDVTSALALIDAVLPDVVLLDVNLANGRKGMEVLNHVRRQLPLAQVIVMTNATTPALRQRYLDAGAQGYFDKAEEFRQACAWIATRACANRWTRCSAPTTRSSRIGKGEGESAVRAEPRSNW